MTTHKRLKRPKIKIQPRKFTFWFWTITLGGAAMLALILVLIGFGAFGKLPTFEELENPKSNIATEIISEDGKVIGSFFIQNRSYVSYEELSPYLVAGLVSTEDARFYNHSGIDFMGLTRVAVKTVAMGQRDAGGGSTISQQLAKNLYPRNVDMNAAELVIAKFKEWITAVMLEYNYTKEEIISMYLNIVEYGSNAYGIKSAARTFFNKSQMDLKIEEAALLVGVVNAPTRYSPVRNPKNALSRRNTVIRRMAANNFITDKEADSLCALPIKLDFKPISHNEGIGTYFREMLRLVMTQDAPKRSQFYNEWDYEQEVKRWEETPLYGWCLKNNTAEGIPYNLYKDGLRIYTTINSKMQQYAEDAVWDHMSADIQPSMDKQIKNRKILFNDLDTESINRIMNSAMKQSDRFRTLKREGMDDADIIKSFREPTEMSVFSYKGDRDTVMTPYDSILYHKAVLRASFMAVDPSNGYVKAYVGGPSFKHFKYDMAKQGKRQVGSTIKPFIYTFAIDHLGYTPCTPVPNLKVSIESPSGDAWSPKEAGKVEYDGVMHPLKWGLAMSRNNYSAWIMKQAQPTAVADLIHKLGVSSFIDPVYAMCLGTPDVSLFEMVGAYATYANRGVHTEPCFVTRIEDKYGNVLATFSTQSNDAVSEQTAFTMLNMLQNNVSSGTGGRLRWRYGFTGEIGGKTGTSQNQSDAWFIGVTPQIVGGTWVGGEDRSIHLLGRGDGATVALPIYANFMKKVYADPELHISQADRFPEPVGAVKFDCDDEQTQTYQEQKSEFFD